MACPFLIISKIGLEPYTRGCLLLAPISKGAYALHSLPLKDVYKRQLEYRVSIDVNKSQVKGKSDARIKKRDSSQVKEPHPDPATNPELFG